MKKRKFKSEGVCFHLPKVKGEMKEREKVAVPNGGVVIDYWRKAERLDHKFLIIFFKDLLESGVPF